VLRLHGSLRHCPLRQQLRRCYSTWMVL
jgi:hypothetical protein